MFHQQFLKEFFLFGGLGKFGVSSQGMWAKALKIGLKIKKSFELPPPRQPHPPKKNPTSSVHPTCLHLSQLTIAWKAVVFVLCLGGLWKKGWMHTLIPAFFDI